MTDILLSDDEDGVTHCVIRIPDRLGPRDWEIIDCPNPRRKIIQSTKFSQKGKIIEGPIPVTRWNLKEAVFDKKDSVCLDCMQCICDCKCDSCEFVDICNVWHH